METKKKIRPIDLNEALPKINTIGDPIQEIERKKKDDELKRLDKILKYNDYFLYTSLFLIVSLFIYYVCQG